MKWFPAWFNDIGFIITFLGFAFTSYQISGLKKRIARKLKSTDSLMSMNKSLGLMRQMKKHSNSGDYLSVMDGITELKSVVIACKLVHKDRTRELQASLKSLTTNQAGVNDLVVNPDNIATFNREPLFSTLDSITDLFSEIIESCKYD